MKTKLSQAVTSDSPIQRVVENYSNTYRCNGVSPVTTRDSELPSPANPHFTLIIEAKPANTPAEVRLRHALKLMLRAYSLRCTSITARPATTKAVQS